MEMEEFSEFCKKTAMEIEESERRTYELMMNAVLVMVAGGENMLGMDLANAMEEAQTQLKREYNNAFGDKDNGQKNSD